MTAMEWSQIVTSVGFPIALIMMFSFACYRGMHWAAPHVVKVVSAHIEFLTSIRESVHGLTESGQKTTHAIMLLTEKMETLTGEICRRDQRTEDLLTMIAARPCLLPTSQEHIEIKGQNK